MTSQDLVSNCRRLSVQAGAFAGATALFLGALQELGVHVSPLLFQGVGIIGAAGVFIGRLIPQPNILPLTPSDSDSKS